MFVLLCIMLLLLEIKDLVKQFSVIFSVVLFNLLFVQLTWADIGAAMVLTNLKETFEPEILAPFKHLDDLNEMVNDLPNIKKYIEARPKTTI